VWLIISVVLQFVLIGVLAVVVLSLARQIGILHERTAPAALVKNAPAALQPGAQLEPLTLTNLAGESLILNADMPPRSSALLFVSADCPICRSVLPAFARALDEHAAAFRGYWVGDGLDGGRFADYAAEHGIDEQRAVLSQELGLRLGIRELPALVLLDADNRLLLREVLTGPKQLTSILAQAPVPASPSGENSR
jgi:methylamine dehydrogenase accessory protein MauD